MQSVLKPALTQLHNCLIQEQLKSLCYVVSGNVSMRVGVANGLLKRSGTSAKNV